VCAPGLEAAAPAIDDPEPYVPGSFDDVVLAYDLGEITDVGYQALAIAAAGVAPGCQARAPRPGGAPRASHSRQFAALACIGPCDQEITSSRWV
jgi:hypothetical protein